MDAATEAAAEAAAVGQREQRLERLESGPDDRRVAEAFAAGGGALTRQGVKELMQRLGRFEGWVETKLAEICEVGLHMPVGDTDATVDSARFAEWWNAAGSLSGPEQLDRRWNEFSARFDRLSRGVFDILKQIPATPTASPLGREQLAQSVSSAATAELLGWPLFPMYVIAVTDVLKLAHPLPPHEEMLANGMLWEVVEDEEELGNFVMYPGRPGGERGPICTMGDLITLREAEARCEAAGEPEPKPEPAAEDPPDAEYMYMSCPVKFSRNRFVAVSHQWLRPSRDPALAHPDSIDCTKLAALQHYLADQTGHYTCG